MSLLHPSSGAVASRHGIVAALVLCAGVSAAPALAAVNAYLSLSGIDGPSTSMPHAIDIYSFSVGASTADAGKLSKAACSNLSVMKALDKTSPLLFQAVLAGQVFASARLTYTKPVGAAQQTYFTLTLANAVLTSVQESGSNENPTESISLQSNTMTLSYWPEKDDGTLGTPVVTNVACPK